MLQELCAIKEIARYLSEPGVHDNSLHFTSQMNILQKNTGRLARSFREGNRVGKRIISLMRTTLADRTATQSAINRSKSLISQCCEQLKRARAIEEASDAKAGIAVCARLENHISACWPKLEELFKEPPSKKSRKVAGIHRRISYRLYSYWHQLASIGQ